ncbi:bifunctional protein-serine/threonine kinase/phosphatase [Marinobacterium sediminicola]|uniref:Serine/threonine protein phosphatase PrpC n=1 Tax=Marinobacterium sediminicola TaxID=518898 RepID=A0ABY1S2Q0_9GAMM|nr:bifunctional protein-serine/threonine kinase/phosphatase [Marinobacterium sediminicola]ULG68472.1 bifunctional protein-serine/threonine kinase/phosphatase [Marinobacterium sediminicola]SMR76762.1 Serine/threonine protein phosphatase PrpC [Marinobacterium sediminicola]
MNSGLKLSLGQFTDKGRKPGNQDFHGALIPSEPQLSLKGAALALADGISSSDVSQIASAAAVKSFLDDYFCTSETWSVKTSAEKVLSATNSWLYAQTASSEYRQDHNRGYVCTFSALILKACSAHLFHVGDTRIYRVRNRTLEQLTKDHRLWISGHESYLSRALGIDDSLELDYQILSLEPGDLYLLATDGVYEHVDNADILALLDTHTDNLNDAARAIVETAFAQGSPDNLTLQILRVDDLPSLGHQVLQQQVEQLPLPPALEPGMVFEGYRIQRELHATSRSHVFLAQDMESGQQVVIKTPSIDLGEDPAYLERFMMEEWIARRINSPHVLKAMPPNRPRHYLYTVTEYIDGQTLSQWISDHPWPDLESVRNIIDQLARGLLAFHRREMVHQDLKPDNVMIDSAGTVRIIDFGATRVAGIVESAHSLEQPHLLGTALYSAPEYFIGEYGDWRADLYSLAVITYQMLSGRFPYGNQVARTRTRAAQQRLSYDSVLDEDREIPAWIDDTLKQALHPDPDRRYQDLSEFIYDLRHPSQRFLNRTKPPLIERSPVRFWQGISLGLALTVVYLLTHTP